MRGSLLVSALSVLVLDLPLHVSAGAPIGSAPGAWRPSADPLIAQAVTTVPDACALAAMVPGALAYGPPPIVRTGTRIVYFGMTASVPGERSQLVLDENGRWVDPTTGERWGEQEVPGAGGAGYTVLRVGYVDAQVAQLTSRLYGWDPLTRQSAYSMAWGLVSHAGCMADYWIHPTALAALAEVDLPGVRILRMPYRLGERVFDAIRIQTTSADAYDAYVFDLASGLMIFHGARATGAPVWTPPVGGQSGLGEGSTQLVSAWIVDVQEAPVPWQAYPAPAWVAGVQRLTYAGTMTSTTAGTSPFQLPIDLEVTVDARGRDWLHARTVSRMGSIQGIPPTVQASIDASGPATIGGLWIAPEALAQLRPGQPIERVEAVGTDTTVGDTTGGRVVIVEQGPLHRIDYAYDRASGVLDAVTLTQQVGIARLVYTMRLVEPPR